MDTLQILGYDKKEVLYESKGTYICRAQNKDGQSVLIKAIKDNQPTTEQLARFEYEYMLLSGHAMAGIVRVKELIKHYRGHIIVMEDAGYIPLKDATIFKSIQQGDSALTNDRLQWILEIFTLMAGVIKEIHDLNIVHRDINPANFQLLPGIKQVCMIDFGLAEKTEYFGGELQHTGVLDGTLAYISPEQTGRMDREVDYRTDFYSLGVTMYELLTGRKPFNVDEPLELVHCHIAELPDTPYSVKQDIPVMVSDIIMKLMEKSPEQRYQNGAGIIQDLEICLERLRDSGVVDRFELGMNDAASKIQIPQRLYGRNEEGERIRQLYTQISAGVTRMLLLGGYSGVGKTSLAQEICRPLAEAGGIFISGKAEQYQSNTPYLVFCRATKDLTQMLLQEPDHKLQKWKGDLLHALKDNGQLLVDMVPELEAVIGPQPRLSELGPAESKNRFLYTYGNFLKVFAYKKHPLTILLDDLQWCDRPSLELIMHLLIREDMESLLLIGCYRDNELREGHPLIALIEELKEEGKAVAFPVKQLGEEHIVEMLSDMCFDNNYIKPLADVMYRKTQGNPFFVHELLRHLFKEHYIHFNGHLHQWECDVDAIDSISISENIVDFMISLLMKLPKETQDILKLAALIGSSFELGILSSVAGISASEVTTGLQKAVEDEIILAGSMNSERSTRYFRFAHDRVQQACVELMDSDQKRRLHLKIGRVLKLNTPKDEWKEQAMDIVFHFNEGLDIIATDEERWETAKLNLWACQKAKGSSAFYLALRYMENSIRLLPENAWEQDYHLTFSIYKHYIECAYLNNEYARAEEQVQYLLQHAKSSREQAEIRWLQSTLFNFQGKLDKAIQYAIQGLQLLKMHVPEKPGMPRVLKEIIFVKARLWGKSMDTLLNLQPMGNERIKLAVELWNEINRAAYLHGNINLFLMSILKQMQMTLRFGNSRNSGKVYVAYAMILAVFGDLKGTYDFCELARMSCEKEGSLESKPTILFSSGFFGHAWNRSWRNIEQWFESSMEEAIKYGDHHTIALAGPFMYAYKPDESIKVLVEKTMNQFTLVRQTNNLLAFNLSFLMIHRWLNNIGLTDGLFSLSISKQTYEKNGGLGIIFSEEECLNSLREGNFLSALGVYYNEKAYIHYLYDDYAEAMSYQKESDQYFKHHTGTPYLVECMMCRFLVLAVNIPGMEEKEVKKTKVRLKKEYKQIKGLAKHCAVNFEHMQYIMEAELTRLENRPHEAMELYDLAIQTASQNGFMRDEATANELAAKMLIWRGKEKQAALYLKEALRGYKLWGADAKVNHMKEKYRYLLKESDYQEEVSELTVTSEALDRTSVEKASRAVSTESQMPDLIDQILKTVIENSGAQRAVMILKSERGWRIVAEARIGIADEKTLHAMPLEQGESVVPVNIVNYCIRTGEYIVLGDAIIASRLNKDPYIQQKQIRSLLCMPLLNHGSMDGVIYLENNLSTDVFKKERIEILRILAGQFSNSINNAKIFIDLLAKTEEVHRASEEVLRSDIAFLQAQIKPHFLYNAINTISAFSLDDSQTTRDLLAKLSEYLRGSFDFKNRDKLVTLRKELELVEAYLFIEKARFGDRLRVSYHIDENADCLLPPLVIQPLVENAVQHGLAGRKRGGTVIITVRGEQDYMVISVEDDGDGMDDAIYAKLFEDGTGKSGGVALKNIQRRLLQLYGRGLEVERKTSGGTKITMRIENK